MAVLDGGTGKRLAAVVDRRVGGSSPTNVFSDWGDVVDACRYWAENISRQLIELGMKPTR